MVFTKANRKQLSTFLRERFAALLDDVLLATTDRTPFMRDAATPYFSLRAREYLDVMYPAQ
jgi:hypothetical protein